MGKGYKFIQNRSITRRKILEKKGFSTFKRLSLGDLLDADTKFCRNILTPGIIDEAIFTHTGFLKQCIFTIYTSIFTICSWYNWWGEFPHQLLAFWNNAYLQLKHAYLQCLPSKMYETIFTHSELVLNQRIFQACKLVIAWFNP